MLRTACPVVWGGGEKNSPLPDWLAAGSGSKMIIEVSDIVCFIYSTGIAGALGSAENASG